MNDKLSEKHEYHSISDAEDEDDFFKPLDLGPSLMDEVFNELGTPNRHTNKENEAHDSAHKKKDLKDLVSNTLNIRRHKKKQLATVKPIKASDEKALESAIAMANALASKSMYDIDKKSMGTDHWHHESSPGRSPLTPNSPSKKFSFFFPSSHSSTHATKSSPKNERKPFLESRRSALDIESALSDQEKQAYNALVGECESLPPLTKLNSPSSMMSQSMACLPTTWSEQHDHFLQLSPPPTFPAPSLPPISDHNPLPLPPRSHTLSRANLHPPKRHVRKNPLIVPSAKVSNLIRHENVVSSCVGYSGLGSARPSTTSTNTTTDDAFEAELEDSIDALDSIGGGEESLFSDDPFNHSKKEKETRRPFFLI